MASSRHPSGFSDNDKSALSLLQLESMSDEDLADLFDQTLKSNDALKKENDIFEKFLKRLDPNDMQNRAPTLLTTQGESKMTRKKGKARSGSSGERMLKLTAEQKCDIATRELDELHEEVERKREEWERLMASHWAVVEETRRRTDEIKKHHYEFERDVIRGGMNSKTGKLQTERVVRYFEDKVASRSALIEKLIAKNNALRTKRRKLQSHLKQKEESGEVRHEVDFEQLKIENKQFAEKFDARNQELLQLKLKSGNTMQVLNSYKKKLQALSSESQSLDSDIHNRRELLARIEAETRIVEKEKRKAESLNKYLRCKLEDYKVPNVIDYVKECSKMDEIDKEEKTWRRKVEIAQLSLKSHKQMWRKLEQGAQAAPWTSNPPPNTTNA